MPSYQSGAPSSLNVINANSSGGPCFAASGLYCREVPDVSANADFLNSAYGLFYNGRWVGAGGTSASTPVWAALAALIDASGTCDGRSIGFANPALYAAAASSYPSNFFDVTHGNNAESGGTLYPAGTRYDMASGLGTPNAANLAGVLCQETYPVTVVQPGSQTSNVGGSVSLQIAANDSNGATLTFSATGLPAGLSINSTGLISGSPTTPRVSSVTVTVTDSMGASAAVSFSWAVTQIASGEIAWGFGADGELGNGTAPMAQTTPVGVSLPAGVTATATAAGNLDGYALGSDGMVYAWGDGHYGELGNGTTPTQLQKTPVAVSLPAGVSAVAVAANWLTGYALGSNGILYAWGNGQLGQLGDGTTTFIQNTPVAVSFPAGVTVTAVATAGSTAYALGSNGSLYAWGYGADGELGDGTTTANQTTPVVVSLPSGVTPTAIAGACSTAYVISSLGTVYAWGDGQFGELGNGTTTLTQTTPTAVSLPAGITATDVAAGCSTAYVMGANGSVYAWGSGNYGQLGNGTTTMQTAPVKVSLPAGVNATAITAVKTSGYAVGSNGALYAWGYGADGELGNGTTTSTQTTPITVSLPVGTFPSQLGASSSQSGTAYALVIPPSPPTITSPNGTALANGAQGSFSFTATGSPGSTFSETGPLPTGVAVSNAGVLSGTPTLAGSFPIMVTASNGVAPDATQRFVLTVTAPPTITTTNNATFAQGVGNTFKITATGVPASTFTETGALPTGVALTNEGLLSGTPTQAGTFPITISATNGAVPDASQPFTLTVTPQTDPAPSGALAWGFGTDGELGNNTTNDPQTTPAVVSLPAGVTATATAGGANTGYAIGSDGTLYAWGVGGYGNLGNGTDPWSQTLPVPVALPAGVTAAAIAAGANTAYAIGSNGTLYAWGYGPDGELGNGTTTMRQTTPVVVALPAGVKARTIAAAGYTGYAIGSNGNLYAWGFGADGELGNNTTTSIQTTPVTVSLPAGVTASAIAAGSFAGYAIGSNGKLYAWGFGQYGGLGNNTTTAAQKTPVTVSLPIGVKPTTIAGGQATGYALGNNGTLYAWGFGADGELGNNSTTFIQKTPVTVALPAGLKAKAVTGALLNGYAIASDNTLYAWGYDDDGELGNNTTTLNQTTPVAVVLPVGVVATALGPEPASTTGYGLVGPPVAPTITSPNSTTSIANTAGTFTVTATGSPAPTFTESGALPAGVTVSSAGVLSGTPTQAGSFPITITATNGVAPDATQQFTLTVNASPTITSTNSTTFTEGTAGTFTVTATGFPAPTFSETGPLPAGVTLSNTGVLSGTPTQAGSFPITLTAANGVAPDATQNFTLTVVAPVLSVSVGDVSVVEGDSGSRSVSFPVTLSQAATTSVSVQYTVVGVDATGGATAGNGNDFKTMSGTVLFAPGATGETPLEKFVTVPVYGDTAVEPDETFTVTLSNVSGGSYLLGKKVGTGTILNDDPSSGLSVSVGDVNVMEGNAGVRTVKVPVTLSAAPGSTTTVSVPYTIVGVDATWGKTANSGNDFGGATAGTLTFTGTTVEKTITITIYGDTIAENNETVHINLGAVTGATSNRPTGTLTILNDD
jgi:alpha-tubulin suppressor-like RCC1 family protein